MNKNNANVLPQVSVSFAEGSVFARSVNVYVESQNGATSYRFALLGGPMAAKGASACAEAKYSKFMPLIEPIITTDLPEGAYILCARGKNNAGIAQQEATSHAWTVGPGSDGADIIDDDEPGHEPDNTETTSTPVQAPSPPNITINVPVQTTPQGMPPPAPMPATAPTTPPPDPTAVMQVRKGNNSGALGHNFTHGNKDVISYYIHNTGDADLTWSISLQTQDADWLKMTYNGETKIGSEISFSGVLAAQSSSTAFALSLSSSENNTVPREYIDFSKRNTHEYLAPLVFTDNNANKTTEVPVKLWIPRLYLNKNVPKRKLMWTLPIQQGDTDWKILRIYKRGKGNLDWRVNKTDYFLFDVQDHNETDGGQFRIRLKDGKKPNVGTRTHIGIIANGGATYRNQPNPSIRWLRVCIVGKEVEKNTECPEPP